MTESLEPYQIIAFNTYAAGKYSQMSQLSQATFWDAPDFPCDNLFLFIAGEVDPDPNGAKCQSIEDAKANLLDASILCDEITELLETYQQPQDENRTKSFINPLQTFVLKHYQGGRYSHFAFFTSEEHFDMELDCHADDFITFVMDEFSTKAGCFSKDDAIRRIRRAEFEIDQIWQALEILDDGKQD
jgi:hypothetical protein